jgi:hypothetical protein
MEIVNPYRPVAEFVLADGVSRKFVWDLNAMAAFETVGAGLQPSQQAALMRALLFAGMFEDARKRGEEWTLEKVGALVPPSQLDSLLEQAQRIKQLAVNGPGESSAGGAAKGKRTRSTSKRR